MKFLNLSSTLIAMLVLVAFSVVGCGGALSAHIGGTVTGLSSGNTVGLINNANGDKLSIPFNSSDNSFTFGQTVDPDMSYNVTVSSQPSGQVCSVVNGIGAISSSGGDVTNIEVTCVSGSGVGVPVFVSVVGLGSGSLVLMLNGDQLNTLTVTRAGGTEKLAFPKTLLPGAPFVVSIKMQPIEQSCTVQPSGSGTMPDTGGGSPSPAIVSCV